MGKSNGNGYPPKVDLQLGQQVRLKLLRPVKEGKNGKDPFYLYRVVDLDTGEEMSFFAPADVHGLIQDQKIGVGGEFLLKRVQNGTASSSKLELSILGRAPEPVRTESDDMKVLLLRSIKVVSEAVQESGIQFSNDSIQDLISTVFIQLTKA
jgi:hypothetical protein